MCVYVGQAFPTAQYEEDAFYDFIGTFLGLLYTFAYIWPLTRVVRLLVTEKETRVAEGMQIMVDLYIKIS